MSKITLFLVLVVVVSMVAARPQGVNVVDQDPGNVNVVDGNQQVNVVDGDEQVNVVDDAGPQFRAQR